MPETILIIEDEKLLGSELQSHYQKQGYEVIWAETSADAENKLKSKKTDPVLVLADLNLPDGNGLDLMEKYQNVLPGCEWVFLTGYGDVPDSVRALRLGAFDFLTKPCPQEKLDMIVQSALRSALAQRRLQYELHNVSEQYTPTSYLGNSSAARETQEMLSQLSQVPFSTMILTGETGTGKGLAVRILHYNGPRSKQPLVELNCAALPKDLLESELFGHEAGSFTGAKGRHRGLIEQANKGTLFLDEIGEMPLELQTKLLKVVEDRKLRRLGGDKEITFEIQIIAATNRNLKDEIKAGNFRSDLYHRLNVFELQLPTLRERPEDLRDLVPVFINEFNLKSNKKVSHVSTQAWTKLEQYQWPGNVRELRNVLERCVLLSTSNQLAEQWLQLQNETPATILLADNPQEVIHINNVPVDTKLLTDLENNQNGIANKELGSKENSSPLVTETADSETIELNECFGIQFPTDGSMGLDDMVAEIIRNMLDRYDGNVSEVAKVLKTTREKVRYRIEKYKLR